MNEGIVKRSDLFKLYPSIFISEQPEMHYPKQVEKTWQKKRENYVWKMSMLSHFRGNIFK